MSDLARAVRHYRSYTNVKENGCKFFRERLFSDKLHKLRLAKILEVSVYKTRLKKGGKRIGADVSRIPPLPKNLNLVYGPELFPE